jgi:hypothetical protein
MWHGQRWCSPAQLQRKHVVRTSSLHHVLAHLHHPPLGCGRQACRGLQAGGQRGRPSSLAAAARLTVLCGGVAQPRVALSAGGVGAGAVRRLFSHPPLAGKGRPLEPQAAGEDVMDRPALHLGCEGLDGGSCRAGVLWQVQLEVGTHRCGPLGWRIWRGCQAE